MKSEIINDEQTNDWFINEFYKPQKKYSINYDRNDPNEWLVDIFGQKWNH